MAKNMNKTINTIAKKAKKNHTATIAVIAGAGLSIVGNITIGTMTVIKAVKNKKATPVADPEPAPAPAPAPAADNSNNNNSTEEENK